MHLTTILTALIAIGGLQVLPYTMYYLFMKRASKRPWNVRVDENYRPRVSLIVPTYNEADAIEAKLRNINELNYPEDLLEVIVVDSASTDGTLDRCREWLAQNNFRFKIKLLSEPQRISKAHALNYALKHASGEVVAISDADAIWEPNSLLASLKYLADPEVAAVGGREVIAEVNTCLTSKIENKYRSAFSTLRLGESKLHSSQIFQGELLVIKRIAVREFVDEPGRSDDNGTITKILMQGKRCFYIPEAVFYDYMPCSMREYLSIKVRRASQVQKEFLIRFKLWISGKVRVPAVTLLMNFYQHLIAPLLFFALISVAVFFFVNLFTQSSLLFYVMLLVITLAMYITRYTVMSYLVGNLALGLALLSLLIKKKSRGWKPIRSSRKYLNALKADAR